MMIKRVDLFLPAADKHEMLYYFTIKLHEALLRLGVTSRLLEAERLNPLPFLQQMFKDPPDCTISFNGLLPDAEGRFFCDLIHIPHVAYLVGSPHHFFALTNTPYNVIASTDRLFALIFKSMGQKSTFFLPHGIDPNQHVTLQNVYADDILFIDGAIDWKQQERAWEKKYPAPICSALIDAATQTIEQKDVSLIQALTGQLQDKVGDTKLWQNEKYNFSIMLDELEEYLQRKNTFLLAQELKDFKCVVLGSAKHLKSQWKKLLGPIPHVKFVEKKGLPTVLQWLGKTKIAINGSPSVKDGTSDYFFLSMISGSVVATNNNRYLNEHFKDGQDLLFFEPTDIKSLKEKIQFLLQNEEKRKLIAAEGRNIVAHHHTWDHRAATLLKEVAPMIAQIKQLQNT